MKNETTCTSQINSLFTITASVSPLTNILKGKIIDKCGVMRNLVINLAAVAWLIVASVPISALLVLHFASRYFPAHVLGCTFKIFKLPTCFLNKEEIFTFQLWAGLFILFPTNLSPISRSTSVLWLIYTWLLGFCWMCELLCRLLNCS